MESTLIKHTTENTKPLPPCLRLHNNSSARNGGVWKLEAGSLAQHFTWLQVAILALLWAEHSSSWGTRDTALPGAPKQLRFCGKHPARLPTTPGSGWVLSLLCLLWGGHGWFGFLSFSGWAPTRRCLRGWTSLKTGCHHHRQSPLFLAHPIHFLCARAQRKLLQEVALAEGEPCISFVELILGWIASQGLVWATYSKVTTVTGGSIGMALSYGWREARQGNPWCTRKSRARHDLKVVLWHIVAVCNPIFLAMMVCMLLCMSVSE